MVSDSGPCVGDAMSGREWANMEYEERVAAAERMAGRVQFENPDATVSVVPVMMGEGESVVIRIDREMWTGRV